MRTVGEILCFIHAMAPSETAMSFDNVGLLVGDDQQEVQTALVALDLTKDVLLQAVSKQAQLVVTHHPIIFHPMKALRSSDLPYQLAVHGISVISAHTNYDVAPKGVNAILADTLGLAQVEPFRLDPNTGMPEGLFGTLPEALSPSAFAAWVKEKLSCPCLHYTNGNRSVQKVAVGCGAGSYLLFDAIKAGADGFVCGESKHHELLAASEAGITMVTAGHFNTEQPAMKSLCRELQAKFPEVSFHLAEQSDPVQYL